MSGKANHVTQSTDSKKPILTTNSNKQYLSFDGSNDSLAGDFSGHILDNPTGQNVTVFTVVKPKGGLYILSTGGQASNSKGYALSYQDYGGINSFSIFRDSSGSREFSIVDSFEANDVHLVTHSYTGSYSNTDVLINGESSGTNYLDSAGSSSNTHQELTIGRPPGYEDYYGNFEIAEVIVISSIDSQKIIDIQYHLSSKWGLTETVDSDGDGALDTLEIEKGSDPKDASDTPYQALPAVEDLNAQYQGTGPFTLSGSNIVQWNDVSGNNRHITTYRGTPYQTSVDKSLFGLTGTGNINVVQGDEDSGFALPFALTSGSYTIAYMARYIGDKDNTAYNKRIFDARSGTGQNTLWGFHGEYAGRSHNGEKGWLTYTDHKMSDPDTWLVGVETEISSRFNGKDFTNKYLHSNGNNYPLRPSSGFNPTLSINYGHYTGQSGSEFSRWQVAELIIWDRELSEEEQKQAEEHLAQKYSHSSFKSVITNVIAYQSHTQTGTYEGWYNIYDGDQWGYGDNNWHGPGFGKFVELNDKWYWGHAFTNGSQAGAVSYSSRNGKNNIHQWTSPSMNNGSYKLHILTNGGGGGGGRSQGSGGGAGGMAFLINRDLANTEFELEVGARGSWGGLWKSNQNGPGGDSTVRWIENSSNKSMSGYGGNEGRDSSSSSVAGGSYNIGDGDGGGPGGDSSFSSHYGRKGGKPYEPQTIVGGQNSVSDIAKALGVVYKEGIYWWWSDYVWGNGGAGSRYGVGMDGYARDGFYGGYGWIMVIMDSNSY